LAHWHIGHGASKQNHDLYFGTLAIVSVWQIEINSNIALWQEGENTKSLHVHIGHGQNNNYAKCLVSCCTLPNEDSPGQAKSFTRAVPGNSYVCARWKDIGSCICKQFSA